MSSLLIPIYLLVGHSSLPLVAKYLAAVSRLLFTGKLKYEGKTCCTADETKERPRQGEDILNQSCGDILPMNFTGLQNFG